MDEFNKKFEHLGENFMSMASVIVRNFVDNYFKNIFGEGIKIDVVDDEQYHYVRIAIPHNWAEKLKTKKAVKK